MISQKKNSHLVMDNKSSKMRVFCLKRAAPTSSGTALTGGNLWKFDDLFCFFIKEVAFADVEGKVDYFAWFMEISCIYF